MRGGNHGDPLHELCEAGLCHAQIGQALNVETSLVTRWFSRTRRRTPNQRARIEEMAERVRACATPLDLVLVLAGGAAALAAGTGRSREEVAAWNLVPEAALDAVVRLTGLQPYVLRPDLYEAPRRRGATGGEAALAA